MTIYRTPPDPISRIVNAEPPPALALSPDRKAYVLLGRPALPGIEELSRPDLRLAGLRIDPATFGPSAPGYLHWIELGTIGESVRRKVDLPDGIRMSDMHWSPDASAISFVNTTERGLELWVVDVRTAIARRLVGPRLNATLDTSYQWEPHGRSLLVKLVQDDRGNSPIRSPTPSGPRIQESLGRVTPSRTYQDLLADPHDELLFEHYFSAEVARVSLEDGTIQALGITGIITDFTPSPSGDFILVERIKRPFSYLVPYYRFPTEIAIHDSAGNPVRQIADLPLADDVPVAFDAVPVGPRSVHWRSDAPHSLAWVEALDQGDPKRDANERDRVFLLSPPFSRDPVPLITLEHRFAGVRWGRDDFAMIFSRWWSTRTERRFGVAPGEEGTAPRLLLERSYEDRYGDPGMPVTTRSPAGRPVLQFTPAGEIFLSGDGASPGGDYPFLDQLNPVTGASRRVWRSEDPYYEEVASLLDDRADRLLTRRQSATEPPNYFVRDLTSGDATSITEFTDPAPELAGIRREILTYARADGVQLSATLITPPGYDAERDGPLPTLIWAYPREFRDAAAASQVDDSPNRFSRPAGASHLFLLTQGYAILDGPAMPIIGPGETEPNDSYIEQLVANAEAAVEAVVSLGVADRNRIAIGGHSYGAFMAANLLAHSNLFKAGIARSGAYNRTLTPFGFQQEQRTYWQAPDAYHRMSPFAHVHAISAPILLIHGEIDNNPGTFPLQTERFYHALMGHGATVRYIVLPFESHGYRARESVLHVIAEMVDWLARWMR